jgi:type VI protein secretion system component VasK
VALQTSLEAIASKPGIPSDADAQPTLNNAQQATVNTRQMAQTFSIDSEGHIENNVQKLLEDPITYTQGLLRTLGPAELNAKGKDMCGQMRPVMSKYPFSPKAQVMANDQDVKAVFAPNSGMLWSFISANFGKVLAKQGSQYVPTGSGGVTVNPAFVAFVNRAAAFSDAAFPGGSPELHFTYTVKPELTPAMDTVHLSIDGTPVDFTAANSAAKTFTWPGNKQGVQMSLKFKGGSPIIYPGYDGLWGIFKFFSDGRPKGNSIEEPLVDRRGMVGTDGATSQPITVTFDVSANPPIFQPGYFSGLGCVAEVAKQ